ncbi:MAG: alpha-E domain-containing protein [Zavarzinella sp.]
MLSRVAENLYWMSRYVERAENAVRFLMEAFQLELEIGSDKDVVLRPLETVFRVLGCSEEYAETLHNHHGSVESIEKALHFMTFSRTGQKSILAMISHARENARTTQEVISTEGWSRLNRCYLSLTKKTAPEQFANGEFRFYEKIKHQCMLFTAIVEGTLPRTEAFHFLRVGRYLEQVCLMCRILRECSHYLPDGHGQTPYGPAVMMWTSVLRSCSGYEAFLRFSGERIDPSRVIGFLVLEEEFPRSMKFAVSRCLHSLQSIAGRQYRTEAERQLGRLEGELRYMNTEEIIALGLVPFLDRVEEICFSVSNDINQLYFSS